MSIRGTRIRVVYVCVFCVRVKYQSAGLWLESHAIWLAEAYHVSLSSTTTCALEHVAAGIMGY